MFLEEIDSHLFLSVLLLLLLIIIIIRTLATAVVEKKNTKYKLDVSEN